MPIFPFITCFPRGFLLVDKEGQVFLKNDTSLNTIAVGGPDLDAERVLAIPVTGEGFFISGHWKVTRDGEGIKFELIGDASIEWGVPLQMTAWRDEIELTLAMQKLINKN